MPEYIFVKNVNASQLDLELKESAIKSAYVNLSANGSVITVNSSRFLSAAEEAILRKAISDHSFASDMDKAVQSKITAAIQFGQQFMIEVAADNVMLRLNTSQIMKMLQKYGHIQAMMQSGSLYTALGALEAIQPDELVSLERKIKYVNKIKKYLGLI